MSDKRLSEITDDDIRAAHIAIEDELIEMRDARIGILGRGNGLVVNERDGTPSSIIRMATPDAIRRAIEVILARQEDDDHCPACLQSYKDEHHPACPILLDNTPEVV